MPIVIVVIAVILIAVGVNNQIGNFISLVKGDFVTGSNGAPPFGVWALAIVLIGALGYYKPLKPFSNAMLVLIFLSIILANKGLFDNLQSAIGKPNQHSSISLFGLTL